MNEVEGVPTRIGSEAKSEGKERRKRKKKVREVIDRSVCEARFEARCSEAERNRGREVWW
jgi:hypothetical protein